MLIPIHTLSSLKRYEAFINMSPNPKSMLGFLLAMNFFSFVPPTKTPQKNPKKPPQKTPKRKP